MTYLFSIRREDFLALWLIYTATFAGYLWLISKPLNTGLRFGLVLALCARLASFFFDPLLSEDYIRFIWDGLQWNKGVHPMAFTPTHLISLTGGTEFEQMLYVSMNSPDYYSVYPPVAQLIYRGIYALSGPDLVSAVLYYKSVILLADAAIVWLLLRLMRLRNIPDKRVLLFALNPLVILEFSGNLHMDGLMIAGLLGMLLCLELKNHWGAIAAIVFSILSKLLTLVLIPFMIEKRAWKKGLLLSILSVGIAYVLIIFFFGNHTGWVESLQLWFQQFEFNASLYYVARYIGFLIKGYNAIEFIGPTLAILFIVGAFFLWLKYIRSGSVDRVESILLLLTLYFLCSTTVHPWYLCTLLVLGVLSRFRYPIAWTYLVMLSYSHYHAGAYQEQYLCIAVEYMLLGAFIIWEMRIRMISRT